MIRRQAFQFELRPNGAQVRTMRRFAGACRYVWNRALADQKQRLANGERLRSYAQSTGELVNWKHDPDTAWLTESPAQPLQQTLKDLDRAIREGLNATSAKRFPCFKKKGRRDSFRYPQGIKHDEPNNRLSLPKIGWVRYRNSQSVLGTIKNVTVSRCVTRWRISIQTERDVETPPHPATSSVGIDMGIARFATPSEGPPIEPLNRFRSLEKRLTRAQRSLSRKTRYSANWYKQKALVNRLHRSIANARKDFLHKASTTISQNHAVVVLEALNVAGLSKRAKGTADEPGRNVAAKSGLNKAILDQGWAEFRRQLEYKLAWAGGELRLVNPAHTSQRCSACGHTEADNRRSQARFVCRLCGHTDHADRNAANNIHAAGHAVSACGADGVGPAMKQEPTEAIPCA